MALRRLGLALLAAGCAALLAGANARAAIVFDSSRCQASGCQTAIWTMNDDGSRMRPITTGGGPDGSNGERLGNEGDYRPTWSPGADFVAFTHGGGYGGRQILEVVAADGSGRHRISPPDTTRYAPQDAWPDWSPLGGLIAFESNRLLPGEESGGPRIWVMTDHGLAAHPITRLDAWAHLPRFTPDGLRVVYIEYAPSHGLRSRLMSVPVTGGVALPVVLGDLAVGPFGLAVSPDGRTIALASEASAITLLDAVTGTLRTIGDAPPAGLTWAQPGPTLVYDAFTGEGNRATIFRIDLTRGAKPQQLTDGRTPSSSPDWSSGDITQPVKDLLPPAVTMLPASVPSKTARAARSASRTPLRFAAVDASGVRSVRAAVARPASHRRCRFLVGHRFTKATRCSRPHWFRVRSASAWKRTTARLKHGRVRVWFRTRDGAGNVTRRPRPFDVRLP